MELIPKLDIETLQLKANEAAMKGYQDAIHDFYNGYNSPYKKQIEAQLLQKGLEHGMNLPDIIAKLNDGMAAKIDEIANEAIAKTFIPLVKKMLTRIDGEVNFSDLLKVVIDANEYEYDDDISISDFEVSELDLRKDEMFLHFTISTPRGEYRMFLCSDKYSKKKEDELKWHIGNLPELTTSYKKAAIMTLKLEDGAKLEMPFFSSVLSDKFVSHCAQMVLSKTNIIFDVVDFDEDLFPSRHGCHCDDY